MTLRTRVLSPVFVRCPGLPFHNLEKLRVRARNNPGANTETDKDVFAARLEHTRSVLWDFLKDPLFVDGLVTLNPELYTGFRRHLDAGLDTAERVSRVRGLERRLYRIATRMCSRNDTTGVAGGTFWGTFEESSKDCLTIEPGTQRHARRSVYPSPAHLASFYEYAARNVFRNACFVDLSPSYRVLENRIFDPLRGVFLSDPPPAPFLERSSGWKWTQLVEAGPLDEPALMGLVERGILRLRIPGKKIPSHVRDLLPLLHEEIKELQYSTPDATRLVEVLGTLVDIQGRLAGAHGDEYARLMDQAQRLSGEFANFVKLDHGPAILSVVKKMVEDPLCRNRVVLQMSRRFAVLGNQLQDRMVGKFHEIPETLGKMLDELDGIRSLSEILRRRSVTDPEEALEWVETLWELVEKGVLCFPEADPLIFGGKGPETALYEGLEGLAQQGFPEPYARIFRLLARSRSDKDMSVGAVYNHHLAKQALEKIGLDAPRLNEDRSFFVEESSRDVARFTVGGELLRRLKRDLDLIFRVQAFSKYLKDRSFSRSVRAFLPIGERMPLGRFLSEMFARGTWEAVTNRLAGLAAQAGTPGEASRRPPAPSLFRDLKVEYDYNKDQRRLTITRVVFPEDFEAWERGKRFVSCFDYMLATDASDPTCTSAEWVINEAHGGGGSYPVTSLALWAQPDPKVSDSGVDRHPREIFGENTLLFEQNLSDKKEISILRQLRGLKLILAGGDSSFLMKRPEMIPISRLFVERTDRSLRVFDSEQAYRLAGGPLSLGNIWGIGNAGIGKALAHLTGHSQERLDEGVLALPEVRLGETVFSRKASLVENGPTLQKLCGLRDEALLDAAQRLRRDLGLSGLVFVKLGDKKPFLCDFDCLFSLEGLAAELREFRGKAYFSDMRPAPEEFWLNLGDGKYTSELRFVGYADGPDFSMDNVQHDLI